MHGYGSLIIGHNDTFGEVLSWWYSTPIEWQGHNKEVTNVFFEHSNVIIKAIAGFADGRSTIFSELEQSPGSLCHIRSVHVHVGHVNKNFNLGHHLETMRDSYTCWIMSWCGAINFSYTCWIMSWCGVINFSYTCWIMSWCGAINFRIQLVQVDMTYRNLTRLNTGTATKVCSNQKQENLMLQWKNSSSKNALSQ